MSDLSDSQAQPAAEIQSQPHNREAEEAVLGAVLINPESYYDIAQILRPDDFYLYRNRWIWQSFTRLREKRVPIDYLTLTNDLQEQNQLSEAGGAAYITQLVTQTPSSLHAESYAEMVRDDAIRRSMLNSADKMAKIAFDRSQPVEIALDTAEKSVFSISERRLQKDVQPIASVMSEVYDNIAERAKDSSDIMGVPTGLHDVDKILGGLQKSDLLIIAGRPGTGKSGFLLSVAKNAALLHKKRVALFSMEMSNEQLAQRLIAQETGIDTQKIRTGKLEANDWNKFVRAIEIYSDTSIFLDDTPAITPLQLRTKCRRLEMEHGLDLVLVDYLQLMSGDIHTDNRVQEVSNISRNLKVLAKELEVPVLAAAQLSRAVEQRTDKRPVLSDLRESGSLEQDADIVMFIHRPNMPDKETQIKPNEFEIIELVVAKHRNGPTHPGIQIFFQGNLTRFASPDRDTLKTLKGA